MNTTGFHPRRSNRYELSVPVSYWWTCSEGRMHAGKGETLNISDSGVLVAAIDCPPIGASIQMAIVLPRLSGPGNGMKLQGEGIVVRVEDAEPSPDFEPGKSFAASVLFYPDSPDQSERPEHNDLEKLGTTVQ